MLVLPNKIVITFLCTLLATSALADAPCDFKSKDTVVYEGTLESVRLIKKDIFPYVEDTRKCTMSIEARVKGKCIHLRVVISLVQICLKWMHVD